MDYLDSGTKPGTTTFDIRHSKSAWGLTRVFPQRKEKLLWTRWPRLGGPQLTVVLNSSRDLLALRRTKSPVWRRAPGDTPQRQNQGSANVLEHNDLKPQEQHLHAPHQLLTHSHTSPGPSANTGEHIRSATARASISNSFTFLYPS